jgi:hypothetical protein
MVDLAGGMRLDRGIERVLHGDDVQSTHLPDLVSILPSREQLRAELDTVIPEPRLAQMLDAFLAPRIEEPEMLMPQGFKAMFEELKAALDAIPVRGEPELAAARRLLDDERASHDLLESYRNVLVGA